MKNTILFDLDGTLLPMDFDRFMELYFYQMGKHFTGKMDSKELMTAILKATEVMVKTNDGRSNVDIFMSYFSTLIDGDIDEYKAHFDVFYETLFNEVQASTWKSEEMKKSVKLLQEKGYNLAIATNPLFPYRANIHRLSWAGFEPDEFAHITSFEENYYCKPYPQFYQEVLDKINKKPEECIMVGNDVFDDLPARTIGIETYLITDCLLNTRNLPIETEYMGTYQDFYRFVQDLPPVK